MHLVEMVQAGQSLPAKLAPELVPPSMRTKTPAGAANRENGPTTPAMTNNQQQQPPQSAEDKRRENFMRGQQELERRQQALREEMQRAEQARLQAERDAEERKERARCAHQPHLWLYYCILLSRPSFTLFSFSPSFSAILEVDHQFQVICFRPGPFTYFVEGSDAQLNKSIIFLIGCDISAISTPDTYHSAVNWMAPKLSQKVECSADNLKLLHVIYQYHS